VHSALAFTRNCLPSKLYCGSQSSFIAPPPILKSLPYYTNIAQPTPPHRPLLCMPYTIHYWWWQYRVKAKLCTVFFCGRLSVWAINRYENSVLVLFCMFLLPVRMSRPWFSFIISKHRCEQTLTIWPFVNPADNRIFLSLFWPNVFSHLAAFNDNGHWSTSLHVTRWVILQWN